MVSNGSPTKDEVTPSCDSVDWKELRARSLQQGGFGSERMDIWPRLLDVSVPKYLLENETKTSSTSSEESEPHSDERQISLDTDRSFVLYPAEPQYDRETLQAGLHKLLVSLFRKRPRLSYFQGYHDIATVFFLTLPTELQLPCLEKVSLHRLRDSMGVGLEPVLGLLRVTKNLLRLADPEYAGVLEQSSPLPFYALSNLLTLFSHDMPSLLLIQHVFDYLLCRPPIASVYLAVVIILSRKCEVLRLQEEDEDGMIHSLLSSLPDLVDNSTELEGTEIKPDPNGIDENLTHDNSTFFKEEYGLDKPASPSARAHVKMEELHVDTTDQPSAVPKPGADYSASREIAVDRSKDDISGLTPKLEDDAEQKPLLQSTELGVESSSGEAESGTGEEKMHHSSPPHPFVSAHPKVTLAELLKAADDLYEKYPPTHPGLALSTIMGPQSVIFTWSESRVALSSDNMVEAMVAHPELVVYPHVEMDEDQKAESSTASNLDRAGAKARRRKRRKLRKLPFGHVEKKTMVAAVIVLGVAMAVYGIKARHTPGGAYGHWHADGHSHGGAKDWKRLGGWLGGALAGMSQKIINGISSNA